MRFLLLFSILLVSISACDRSKGKGSDIEWQQRQEIQRQEEIQNRNERDGEEQRYKDLIYRDLNEDGREGLQNAGPT